MATEWQMSRRSDHCLSCAAALGAGAVYRAYLYESAQGYERRDYCDVCTPPADPAPVGFWRGRRPVSTDSASAAPFDREAVFAFFQRLSDDTPERRQFRFVLALLLWRKKVLKLESADSGANGETWRFVAPHVGESYAVERPDLSDDDATRLSADVERLIAGGQADETLLAAGQG